MRAHNTASIVVFEGDIVAITDRQDDACVFAWV